MKYESRHFKYLLLLFSFLILSACASAPSVSLEEKEAAIVGYELPMTPDGDQGVIYILRPDSLAGAVRFKVFLDGKKEDGKYIGYTRGTQYLSFPVSVGKHTINSKAENWSTVSFSVDPGDIVYLVQVPQVGFLFSGNTIVEVDRVDGQYFMVKYNLELGTYTDDE
jgi:hypothetical protein